MRQLSFRPGAAALLALALVTGGAAAAHAQDAEVPFASMRLTGGVIGQGEISVLSFEVDFSLGPESDGFVLGGGEGERFAIETSLGLPPGAPQPPQDALQDEIPRRALRLDISVDGGCFAVKNGRFRLRLGDPKTLAACVRTTIQMPGFPPVPLDLLESMEVNLWRRGRPERWRMRSTARFATPPFGYPVAGLGPDNWTALVLGDDRGQTPTGSVAFEGGR